MKKQIKYNKWLFVITILLSSFMFSGCAIFKSVDNHGYGEQGRETPVTDNIKYGVERENGEVPSVYEVDKEEKERKADFDRNCLVYNNTTEMYTNVCPAYRPYEMTTNEKALYKNTTILLNKTLFAVNKALEISEYRYLTKNVQYSESPELLPVKVVTVNIFPYSDGDKFYLARQVYAKYQLSAWYYQGNIYRGGKLYMGIDKDSYGLGGITNDVELQPIMQDVTNNITTNTTTEQPVMNNTMNVTHERSTQQAKAVVKVSLANVRECGKDSDSCKVITTLTQGTVLNVLDTNKLQDNKTEWLHVNLTNIVDSCTANNINCDGYINRELVLINE